MPPTDAHPIEEELIDGLGAREDGDGAAVQKARAVALEHSHVGVVVRVEDDEVGLAGDSCRRERSIGHRGINSIDQKSTILKTNKIR